MIDQRLMWELGYEGYTPPSDNNPMAAGYDGEDIRPEAELTYLRVPIEAVIASYPASFFGMRREVKLNPDYEGDYRVDTPDKC